MIDIKRRLARLESTRQRAPESDSRPEYPSDLPPQLGFTKTRGVAGTIWIRERPVTEIEWPATLPLDDLNALFTRSVPHCVSPDEFLFLDVETTGLSGGTGTLAFLVGLLRVDRQKQVRLTQYFLPSPSSESAMLAQLQLVCAESRVILTYNGNGFDLPLLRTRGILSRIRDMFTDTISWDLLPAVRRLWGRGLPDCRQQTMETELTGNPRGSGDVEGHLIPRLWLDFVHSGRPDGLLEVVTHNDRDMIGMLRIFAAITERMQVYTEVCHGSDLTWPEAWALSLLAERRGDRRREAVWMRYAVWVASTQQRPERFWRDALRQHKRFATDSEIDAVLRSASGQVRVQPWLDREYAIFHEHRRRDPVTALTYARRLGEARRIERLQQKIGTRSDKKGER